MNLKGSFLLCFFLKKRFNLTTQNLKNKSSAKMGNFVSLGLVGLHRFFGNFCFDISRFEVTASLHRKGGEILLQGNTLTKGTK